MAEEELPPIELGDRIMILGGPHDSTKGRVYYLDEELISILTDGASNRLIQIPILNGDFSEEQGVESIFPISKRASDAFVVQIDAQKGGTADSFSADGEPGIQYFIEDVNPGEDTLTLRDTTGDVRTYEMNGIGIPRDAPFAVLRPRPPPSDEEEGAAVPEEEVYPDEFGDLEEPDEDLPVMGLLEIPESQQIFSDTVQRNDMIKDFIVNLPEAFQKSAKQHALIRSLVEQCILLRNELVLYNSAGDPYGRAPTSYQTVVDILDHGDIPLSRPVLDAKRALYIDRTVEGPNPSEVPGVNVELHYQDLEYLSAEDYLKSQLAGGAEVAPSPDMLPYWFLGWETFFKRFMRSWASQGAPGEAVSFRGDKEFLRAPAPKYDEDGKEMEAEVDALAFSETAKPSKFAALKTSAGEEGAAVPENAGANQPEEGLEPRPAPAEDEEGPQEPTEEQLNQAVAENRKKAKKTIQVLTADSIGKARISLLKGLGPRYTRLKAKDPLRKIETGDEAVIQSHLIFPLSMERDLGPTRSGRLSKDMMYSHSNPRSMIEVLDEVGGVPDTATAGGILSIGIGGNTTGMIPIDEWLKAQPIHVGGLGDAMLELKSLGLSQKELTSDQQNILIDKIKQYHALLKEAIRDEREFAKKELADLKVENTTFLQGEALEDLMATLAEEPLLSEAVDLLRRKLPAYRENDIALFAGCAAQMADLLLVALAAQPGPLARERNRLVRDRFLDALRKALAKAQKEDGAGDAPVPIACAHVQSLTAIRKIKDADDRMQAMAKFLANYKKEVRDNWVKCAVSTDKSDHNLLCYHEVLLLREYLFPLEKDTIHKELLLTFSGGVFQGRYICKNCGQFISDLEFDQSLEFDEEGRPLAKAVPIQDISEKEEAALESLISGNAEEDAKLNLTSEREILIYSTAQEIFSRVGIYCDTDSFKQIIQRVSNDIQRQPTRKEYATRAKRRGGASLDYDVFLNRILVASVAAHCLIEIQAKVPDFVVRYRLPGCRAGFTGYPIGREDDRTGLEYMACVIASIKRSAAPWSLTGFLAVSSEKKREEMILLYMDNVIKEAVKTASVQQLFIEKRQYIERLFGKGAALGDKVQESVGAGFRPVPYVVSAEEAAENAVVPAAANPEELVRGWLQSGHRLARKHGKFIRGSPFSETTCCFTPIVEPRGFWSKGDLGLPALPAKRPPRGQSSTQTIATFTPRRLVKLLADPPEELFYRVFLRVCFDGPRKGLPHEPGYDKKCPHCGLQLSDNPFLIAPSPPLSSDKTVAKEMMKDWQKEMDGLILKGKGDLDAQRIVVNKQTFEDVLDATHLAYRIEKKDPPEILSSMELLSELARMDPEPFEGWRVLMAETVVRCSRLPAEGADELTVAEAYGALSNKFMEVLSDIQRRIGPEPAAAFKKLFSQTPTQVVETVRTYFLVPFQRLLVGFKPDSFFVQSSYKLPAPTKKDVETFMALHLAYLGTAKKSVKGYVTLKLRQARLQLGRVLPIIQKEIRANLVPGGATGLPYLVGTLILGILGEFINPNVVPDGPMPPGYDGTVDPNARVPLGLLDLCLKRLAAEGLSYTEDEIQAILARRAEMEKELMIKRFSLPPQEKKDAMRMKRLGLLADLAAGARNVITLNEETYERDRGQRAAMGLQDFRFDPDTARAIMALEYNNSYGGGGMGAEAGYDNAQMAADDY